MSTSPPLNTSSATQLLPEYNVLVLGGTRSGKSTLIEYMRKYADPKVEINTKALGTGSRAFLSHTQEVKKVTIVTDLPEYYVEDMKDMGRINYDDLLRNIVDVEDYVDALNKRRDLVSKNGAPQLPKKVKFNLIDTPGLNATSGDVEKHIQGIFSELVEAKTIHLLLITIYPASYNQGLEDVIKAYVDLFPGFNGITAFVHTHFNYDFLPQRFRVAHAMDLSMKSLHRNLGRTTFPHFKIDCDGHNRWPIRGCITQNTIQKILELATFNEPINMLRTVINKSRKMCDIDNILKDKFETMSATIEKTLKFKDAEEGELLAEIYRNEINVHKLEAHIKVLDEFFAHHDVNLLEMLHEERRDADNEVKQDSMIIMRYPETGELGCTIKRRDLLCHNVQVIKEDGSEDDVKPWTSWEGEFQQTPGQHSVLHVKMYATKSDLHQREIAEKRIIHAELTEELKVAKKIQDSYAQKNENKRQLIKEFVDNHSEYIQILEFVSNKHLAPEVFSALIQAEAYIYDTAVCAKKVQAVYMSLGRVKSAKPDPKATEKQKDTDSLPAYFPFSKKVRVTLSPHFMPELGTDLKPTWLSASLPHARPESDSHSGLMAKGSSHPLIKPGIHPAPIKFSPKDSIPELLIRDRITSTFDRTVSSSSTILGDPSPSPTIPTYLTPQKRSILVLGKSQVGKTALIEHIKNYCSPRYAINQTRIGDGTFSKTDEVSSFLGESNLPLYEVYNKVSGATIDLDGKRKDANAGFFQDLLLSREDEVGLRLPREDPIGSTPDDKSGFSQDIMKFEIIDTPGFCNHRGQDLELSLSTRDMILSTRSFDLVLIVINIHDSLSAEEVLSFQYFSEVLGPLNSKIAFLYTHADIGDHHPANPSQYMALANKTLFLSSIFRQPESDDVVLYPSFTIDLAQRNMPVGQYMIRKTIRDILHRAASNVPASIDNSDASIRRIMDIIHPSEYDDMQREMALARIYGESQIQSKPLGHLPVPSEADLETINILLIGDAQSGKSYLIESMKQYVNPLSISSMELIAKGENGNEDELIRGCSFVADMHTIDILKAEEIHDHRVINIKQEAESLSAQEFTELLAMGHGVISTCISRSCTPRKYQFGVFEVPSWQEDIDSLSSKAAVICRAVSKSDKEIHQVLVTLGPEAITNTTRMVISTLFNMFPAIAPLLSFVHTKVYYPNLHISNTYFHNSMSTKKVELQGLIRSDPPIFKIDSNLYMNRPVQRAITLNTIHDILMTAVKTKPKFSVLVLGKTQSGKSSFIQHIKNYADPACIINRSLLGNGNVSCTNSVQQIFVHSDLPAYEVLDIGNGSTFNPQMLDTMIPCQDHYVDLINGHKTKYKLRMAPQNPASPPSKLVEFRFLDTPGMNDTQQRDDGFAKEIIEEIIATRSFNLILIAVSAKSALSMEYGFILEYYAKVLQGLHSNIAFLYTHIDYADCHHTNTLHHSSMVTRHNAFSSIFKDLRYLPKEKSVSGTDMKELKDYKRFLIDFNTKKRPVIQCLIRNTLRDILQLAVTSPPVELDTSSSNIERIKAISHPDKENRKCRDQFKKNMEALTTDLADVEASSQRVHDDDTEDDLAGYNIDLLPSSTGASKGFVCIDYEYPDLEPQEDADTDDDEDNSMKEE